MKSFEQIAQATYAAFVKKALQLDPTLKSLPWEEVDEKEKQCWLEAVKQTSAELALVH
ncbi:hypothetical protein P3G55_17410 [Leptospira sp. 96542]|jgi:hypothetical protein|nr:hypothetical protein [Leptospira sp. 96542]